MFRHVLRLWSNVDYRSAGKSWDRLWTPQRQILKSKTFPGQESNLQGSNPPEGETTHRAELKSSSRCLEEQRVESDQGDEEPQIWNIGWNTSSSQEREKQLKTDFQQQKIFGFRISSKKERKRSKEFCQNLLGQKRRDADAGHLCDGTGGPSDRSRHFRDQQNLLHPDQKRLCCLTSSRPSVAANGPFPVSCTSRAHALLTAGLWRSTVPDISGTLRNRPQQSSQLA